MEKVGAYKHPTETASGKKVEPPIFPKGNNSSFFGKLNRREAHLPGKGICKPEASFANQPLFCTASRSRLPMQHKLCKVITAATERQLKAIKARNENKPNSPLPPSKQTDRQK